MFRQALRIVSPYTWPVVISRMTVDGSCGSGIGTFVVVNEEGWIVTAAHILEEIEKLASQEQQCRTREADVAAINTDPNLGRWKKRRRIGALPRLDRRHTRRYSPWWGRDGVRLMDAVRINQADIGVGRLEPFDSHWVPHYPVFKDPQRDFEPGEALCRLGYPFHAITPTWDEQAGTFQLPAGAIPIPLFPIEGIYTRTVEIIVTDSQGNPVSSPFPLRWIETSSPGLRGQSGGPIFDTQGSIWGIQSNTMHLALGFDPVVPGMPKQREHQFLNVGRGAHAETALGLFNEIGIRYRTSAY